MSSRIKSSFALTVLLAVLLLLPGIADSGRGFVLADVKNGGSGHGLPRVRERIALRGGHDGNRDGAGGRNDGDDYGSCLRPARVARMAYFSPEPPPLPSE